MTEINIKRIITRTDSSNPLVITKRNPQVKEFGKYKAPHILSVEYAKGEWGTPKIEPYKNLEIDPGAKMIHYAQGIFEGAKAFKHENGEVYTFRFKENIERLNKSAEFLDMPTVPAEIQMQGLHTLLDIDRDYFPTNKGATMYIRPFLFCTDGDLNPGKGETYSYHIILSPSGPYFGKILKPIDVLIAGESFKRVPKGGMGNAKASSNYQSYAAHMKVVNKFGADQPLYGYPRIEETGTSNHYHITNEGEFIVPGFNNNILESITARSLLELSPQVGLTPIQKDTQVAKFLELLHHPDELTGIVEAGILGTAATIVPVQTYIQIENLPSFYDLKNKPVESFNIKHHDVYYRVGPHTKKLHELYTGIQQGTQEDIHGWLEHVEKKF